MSAESQHQASEQHSTAEGVQTDVRLQQEEQQKATRESVANLLPAEPQHQANSGVNFDQVFVTYKGQLQIPAGADRLMPPPFSVQEQLKDLNKAKQWGGQYSWQPPEKRATPEEMGGRIDKDSDIARQYRALMKQWLCQRHHMAKGVQDDWLMVREGVRKTYEDLMDAFDEDGKPGRFVVITPTFSNIVSAVASTSDGRKRKKKHVFFLMEDTRNGWQLPPDLESSLQPGDLLVLCNPNNPNGYVYTEKDLQTILSACKKKGVRIISDDIWSDQVFDPDKKPHIPIINVAIDQDYASGVALLYSTGKAFNTEAIPCSIAIIPDRAMRDQLTKKDAPTRLGAQLAIGALNPDSGDGGTYMDELNPILKENMEYVRGVLEQMQCKVHPSDSCSVLFVQLPQHHQEKKALLTKMREEGIGYIPGIEYYEPIPRDQRESDKKIEELAMRSAYIRINIGCPKFDLEEKFGNLLR